MTGTGWPVWQSEWVDRTDRQSEREINRRRRCRCQVERRRRCFCIDNRSSRVKQCINYIGSLLWWKRTGCCCNCLPRKTNESQMNILFALHLSCKRPPRRWRWLVSVKLIGFYYNNFNGQYLKWLLLLQLIDQRWQTETVCICRVWPEACYRHHL